MGTKGTGQNYNRWELESECSVIMLLVEITNGFELDASRENLGWRGELKDIFVLQMGLKHIQDPLCISGNFSSAVHCKHNKHNIFSQLHYNTAKV